MCGGALRLWRLCRIGARARARALSLLLLALRARPIGSRPQSVLATLARHEALVDKVSAQRGGIRVERTQTLIDLLLRIAVLLLEDSAGELMEDHESLRTLRRDARQQAVLEERAQDLGLLGA